MKIRLSRRLALTLALVTGILVVPLVVGGLSTPVSAAPCDLSGPLNPEMVGGGVDGLIQAPAPPAGTQASTTNYAQFGMSGQFWHTHELGCADYVAVLGNMWANGVFTAAKAIDRLTITTYQAAATEGPLQSIKDVVDDIVTNLSNAMYWPYLRPIVILGAIWLAWYGLIRKRATTTAEGVIWMVLAVTVATWFFSRPGDFTGLGKVVTDKTGEVVNSAFSGLPGAGGASCLPPPGSTSPGAAAPAVRAGGYAQPGTPGVDQNADALWSTLVCKPWLVGMFGTADPQQPIVRDWGRKVLEMQSIPPAVAGQEAPDVGARQQEYAALADKLRNDPRYTVFSGRDWANRLGVAVGALIAAVVAGLLIFLVAVSLLVLKVGFLLLLILGPVFLLVGVHPGSGRIIAMRWVEMLIGTLLRQAVLTLVLSVLVYGYALIISTAMPWGMQVLFMALLTIAVFFYRRPFQHLFASINGHTVTTRMLGDAASSSVLERSAGVLPPVASARIGRWGLRKAEPVIRAAAAANPAGAAATTAATTGQARVRAEEGEGMPAGTRLPATAAPLDTDQQGGKAAARAATEPRRGTAPPLNLGGTTRSRGAGGPRVGGIGAAGGTGGRPGGSGGARSTGGAAASNGSSGAPSGGGWFGGGSGGGWARRGGSSGGLSGGSSGGSSSGSSRGSRFSGSGGSRGGGLFGGSGGARGGGSLFGGGGSRNGGPRSSGGGSRGGARTSGGGPRIFGSDEPASRASEAPPLWLQSTGNGGSTDRPSVPFWLKPNNSDKD
ncbi:MAG TPA: type IV secretion system protein [Nonomuraea sp.]|nr:type IV secretion system protein [Nonomuraea sp.]